MPLTTVEAVAEAMRWGEAEKAKYASQLPGYIAAAEESIEYEAGSINLAERSYTADGGGAVLLPERPNEVSAVLIDGQPAAGWIPDLQAGIVYGPFPRGIQNVTVKYMVGPEVVSASKSLACVALTMHIWSIVAQRTQGLPEDFTVVPTGFLVPNAVKQLLMGDSSKMPGFA